MVVLFLLNASLSFLSLNAFMDEKTVKDEFWLWLLGVGGVLPAMSTLAALFLWNLACAPFRLERERADAAAATAADTRRELEGLSRERRGSLAIIGLREEAKWANSAGLAHRHFMVEVHNEGGATIPDCRLRLTDLRASDGSRSGLLPVLLLPLDRERPHEGDGAFSLHGGETKSVSLAWLTETGPDREISIGSFSRRQPVRVSRHDRYMLTVSAFGGGNPASASYAMRVSDAGRLTLEPLLNPTGVPWRPSP